MKPKLLFLNHYKTNAIPDRLDAYFVSCGFSVDVRHVWSEPLPPSPENYQAVFLSGSEISPWENIDWVKDEITFLHRVADARTPTLGVCFGAQIVPYALCGDKTIFRRTEYEIGLIDLYTNDLLQSDPIGQALPSTFSIFSWHRDEIVADHHDINVLAVSGDCANHIWRHRELPVWGVQAHPEAGGRYSRDWLNQYKGQLLNAGLDFSDHRYASGVSTLAAMSLFDNFAAYALDKSSAA